jgi:phosphatidylserine/phosphatidylglycerophosphate/cardiolipin synthase-like enzyme
MVRYCALVAIFFAGCVLSTHALCSDLSQAHVAVTVESVSPQEWARLCLEQCRAEFEDRAIELSSLRQLLVQSAQSAEELQFPDRETSQNARVVEKERRLRVNQLNYLLFRSKSRVLGNLLRERLQLDEETFGRTLDILTAGATPCVLDALESTLLIAAFGLPLKKQWAEQGISPAAVLEEVESEYARRSKANQTAEETYFELRSTNERNKAVLEPVLQRVITFSMAHETLDPDLRQKVVQQIIQFFQLSAESLRVRVYLNMTVASVETSFGVRLSQNSVGRLQTKVAKVLFRDPATMGQTANVSPQDISRRVYPLIDEWFQKEALPALQKEVYGDPFSAFWFYVQTGMVAERPAAFRDARLELDPRTPDLNMLKKHTMTGAHELLFHNKIPTSYIKWFNKIEESMTNTFLSPQELLRRASGTGINPKEQNQLKRLLQDEGVGQSLSSLDLVSFFVRDASRFQGAPDTRVLLAGLAVFREAKHEKLEQEILNLPQSPDSGRLATYLRTAAAWMFELEERQAREHRFQESIGGGPIGWILRHVAIGNGVPVQLWAPGGVTGESFARLVDVVVTSDTKSGRSYRGKLSSEMEFLEAGEDYHKAMLRLIDRAEDFLNIQQFDWKPDRGGREINYRLMAKKLGLSSKEYDALTSEIQVGIPLNHDAKQKTAFYDIPPSQIKNLLFYKFFSDSQRSPIRELRQRLERSLAAKMDCSFVDTCGDFSKLYNIAGRHYDPARRFDPAYSEIWQIFRDLQSLFEEDRPKLENTKPQPSLAEYLKDRSHVQRFVGRYGLKRRSASEEPFDINIVVDGKQNISWFRPSTQFPFAYADPLRSLHDQLLEFNVRVIRWKGPIEFPWHVGKLPIGGRRIGGFFPLVYVPWPWLQYAPGFGWAGVGWSLVIQHIVTTDMRTWWATAMHTKSLSNEAEALEGGMGFATKYFNIYPGFRTWHDVGGVVKGPIVNDINDQFVGIFNHARVNNRGIPESRGVDIPALRYSDYESKDEAQSGYRTWMLTTDPTDKNYNYRGVFMAALAGARENIYIENVYYSDPLISRMLVRKAREFRGRVDCSGLTDLECNAKKRDAVRIYIVLPEASDRPPIDVIGRSDFYEMINEGVKVFRWAPPRGYASERMLHTKAWMVDYKEGQPALSYVGSHNADQRSLWADNEMGILSTSPQFAKQLHDNLFQVDLRRDSTPANRSSLEIEGLMNIHRILGPFLRLVLVDLSWFF